MLLDYVVCVVVIQTPSFSYFLTTILTTLPLGNNTPQRHGNINYYFPRRVAVLLPHEMLLDYVVIVVVNIVFVGLFHNSAFEVLGQVHPRLLRRVIRGHLLHIVSYH